MTPARELLKQANLVSKNRKIQVHKSTIRILQRAISARKRCADWFTVTGAQNGHSTEGHLHFINLLEEAIQLLKPGYNGNSKSESRRKTAASTPDISIEIENRFSNLEIEETEYDSDLEASSKEASYSTSAPSAAKKHVYELERNVPAEQAFLIFCLFEDFHRLQRFLAETWTKYKKGDIDLITASMTTNCAFALARREELKVMETLFHGYGMENYMSYHNLVMFLWESEEFGTPKEGETSDGLEREGCAGTSFDDFLYLSTANSLYKYAIAYQHSRTKAYRRFREHIVRLLPGFWCVITNLTRFYLPSMLPINVHL